jgi:hypothetical protein
MDTNLSQILKGICLEYGIDESEALPSLRK